MRQPPTRQRGFTIVELVVLLAVTTVTSSLAAQGIFRSRAEVRKKICMNNLKQMGIAMHNYHETFGTFPPGWTAHDSKAKSGPRHGWLASILPQIEQSRLYNELDFEAKTFKLSPLLQRKIPVYLCPSSGNSETNGARGEFGIAHYSGNHGTERLPGSKDTPREANGIFYWNSFVRIRNVTGGMSNTFLVGERGTSSAAGIWAGVRQNQKENDAVTDCSAHSKLNSVMTGFSSDHQDGANFLMGDGAVKFIADDIDSSDDDGKLGVYQKLSHREHAP